MIKIIDVKNKTHVDELNAAAKLVFDNPSTHGLLVKMYANWCGHCQNMATDWERLIRELKHKYRCKNPGCTLTIANVEIQNLDDSDPILRGIKHIPKDINGVPSIMYVSKGKRGIEYSGERVYKQLLKWVVEHPQFGLMKKGEKSSAVKEDKTHTTRAKQITKRARTKFRLFHKRSLRRFHNMMKRQHKRSVTTRDPTPRRVTTRRPAYLRLM
jgi:hypothetical protein